MTYLLALSIVANVALVVVFVRTQAAERRGLLDRIQAPQQAVVQSMYPEDSDEPSYIPLHDDEALAEYLKQRG